MLGAAAVAPPVAGDTVTFAVSGPDKESCAPTLSPDVVAVVALLHAAAMQQKMPAAITGIEIPLRLTGLYTFISFWVSIFINCYEL
jgi:hypothetical protein